MSLKTDPSVENVRGFKLRKKYYSCRKLLFSKREDKENNDNNENRNYRRNIDKKNKKDKEDSKKVMYNKKLMHLIEKSDSKIFDYSNLSKKQLTDSIIYDDVLIINDYIMLTLKNFVEKNKGNNKYIYTNLNKIYSLINSFISSLSNNDNAKNKEINEGEKDNKIKCENKINLLYEIKIDELNKKIKDLSKELESLTTKGEIKKNNRIIFLLKKKNSELENKLKLNEFKYLLCIKEQQKRISELEDTLKMKNIDNNCVKDIRCFPNLIQYNYKNDINPKSIPLTKSILKNKISPKTQKNRSINNIKDSKKNSLIITNSNKNIFKSKKKDLKSLYNFSQGPKEYMPIKSVDFCRNRNNYADEEINNIINSISSRTKQKTIDNEDSEQRLQYMLNCKDINNSESIIHKDKKYFISHPNLTITGISSRRNNYMNGMPNRLFSFKSTKKLEKNAFFIFPSTLSETLVNLEKLRINKNYLDKDDAM